jgi:hypothetical protein
MIMSTWPVAVAERFTRKSLSLRVLVIIRPRRSICRITTTKREAVSTQQTDRRLWRVIQSNRLIQVVTSPWFWMRLRVSASNPRAAVA